MTSFLRKLWWLMRRKGKEEQLAAELEFHLAQEAEERQADGMSAEDAGWAARRELGNLSAVREDTRATWRWVLLEQLVQDVRYAARGLRRKPGFAAVIILSLALGIGANAAIFSALNSVLLRPLHVDHPEEIFGLDITESQFRAPQRFSYPLFEQLRQARGGEAAAMSRVARMFGQVTGDNEQDITRVQLVSGEFFSLLGIAPARGRLLTPSDNLALAMHPVAVVSHAFWQQKLGGSDAVIGRTVNLNGAQFTIIGVAPAAFNGLWLESPVDVWIPLMMQSVAHYQQNFSSSDAQEDKPWPSQDGIRWLDVIVRTRKNLPALQSIFHGWLESHTAQVSAGAERQLFLQQKLMLDPLTQGYSNVRGQIQGPLYALGCMVALVLLIACANCANLILSRGASRQREIAMRLSIGASRARIIRQLLTETFLLVVIGGAAGVVAARLGSGVLVRSILGFSTGASPVTAGVDWRVLSFALVASIIAGLLCGLTPAFRATQVELDVAIKSGTRSTAAKSRSRLPEILVAAQIAFVFVLLVGAAWFSGSLRYLAQLNLGYDQDQVVTVWVRPELTAYTKEQLPALHRRLVETMEALPGVQSAVYAMCGLASGCRTSSKITVAGFQPVPGENVEVQENRVGPHYFSTVGMRLLEGRDFTDHDAEKSPLVAIVNRTAAQRYFSNGKAIDGKFGYGQANVQIIGVVADARVNSEREAASPMVFYPLAQGTSYGGCVEIRMTGDAAERIGEIRRALTKVEPNLPIDSIRTVRNQVNGNLRRDKLIVVLVSVFGALALGLACFGIYGTMSYAVARRTNEIGVRMALGAVPSHVFRLVFGESFALVGLGLLIGAPLVFAASRPISTVVLGIDVRDPLIPIGAAVVVILTSTLAAYIPAWRASRVEPTVALRYE